MRRPRPRSDLLFKGVVANKAHSVYSGLIRVEKGAKGTNAFQTNRNLVLSEGAQADSVPNLEIEDNDVRCSHASAVGPIDESERFYLESRGVPATRSGTLDRAWVYRRRPRAVPRPRQLGVAAPGICEQIKFRRFRRLVESRPGRWARTWGRSRLRALSEELP